KNSVSQSINAPKLRFKVGKAKAARAAMLGKANISARSASNVNRVLKHAKAQIHTGHAKCMLLLGRTSCLRQRHKVHTANGQVGQLNHISKRAMLCHCLPSCKGLIKR